MGFCLNKAEVAQEPFRSAEEASIYYAKCNNRKGEGETSALLPLGCGPPALGCCSLWGSPWWETRRNLKKFTNNVASLPTAVSSTPPLWTDDNRDKKCCRVPLLTWHSTSVHFQRQMTKHSHCRLQTSWLTDEIFIGTSGRWKSGT